MRDATAKRSVSFVHSGFGIIVLVCVECGERIQGEFTPLPNNQVLCESCSDEILDIPARSEREATRDSRDGVGEW